MHALARQGIQINGQCGSEGFPLTGTHFRNFAVVQRHAAEQLHIKMTHLHDAFGAFTHDGKSLWQQRIKWLTLIYPLFEFISFGTQGLVREFFKIRLQCIDFGDRVPVFFEQAVIATTENFSEEVGGHGYGVRSISHSWQTHYTLLFTI
ncbi:hypothetical protein GALL_461830 [mine drainage metagenome]|uniref:Uncharacterized protein n=1 Tax=mine drainage metagenome TaxID=410659 RepID=A0A1J5PM03_9ZZZZ